MPKLSIEDAKVLELERKEQEQLSPIATYEFKTKYKIDSIDYGLFDGKYQFMIYMDMVEDTEEFSDIWYIPPIFKSIDEMPKFLESHKVTNISEAVGTTHQTLSTMKVYK